MQKHPARYSEQFIPIFSEILRNSPVILDPMAGTGERLKQLSEKLPNSKIIGIELEPEWANITPEIVQVGNILNLPFDNNSIHSILVSPPYGNRMADNDKPNSGRISYTSFLGRLLSVDSGASLQWGKKYWSFFENAWEECYRVNTDLLVLNVKDFYRNRERVHVSQWHVDTLLSIGYNHIETREEKVKSMGKGQNRELRVDYESIFVFRR